MWALGRECHIKMRTGEGGSHRCLLTPGSWWEKTTDTRLLNILQCWGPSSDDLSSPVLTPSLLRNTATMFSLLKGAWHFKVAQFYEAPLPLPQILICSGTSGKNHRCLSLLHAHLHHRMEHHHPWVKHHSYIGTARPAARCVVFHLLTLSKHFTSVIC